MEKVFEIQGIKFYVRNNVPESEVSQVVGKLKGLCERSEKPFDRLEVEIYE